MVKLAIIYDWIDKWGGAERILTTLFDSYPTADIYTLYTDYNKAVWAKKYSSRIKTTFLQSWYNILPHKQLLIPLMPSAIESLYLSKYDAVMSVTSSFAKGVITRPETKHISYIFTPTRFLWHEKEYYTGPRLLRFARNDDKIRKWLQDWDMIASRRPDTVLTLSEHTRSLVTTTYHRPSLVVYPPFDSEYYKDLKKNGKKPTILLPKDYFLFVGRLEPYKRINLLIAAFAAMPHKQLLIVGTGSERKKLHTHAQGMKNIIFLDALTDNELAYVYQQTTALLMPQVEDFGYTALESLFFGTPVISYVKSGAAEIVQNKRNGILFTEQTSEEIVKQVEKFSRADYNVDTQIVNRFTKEKFLKQITNLLHN